MSKESQHKQNNAVMQKHAIVLDARASRWLSFGIQQPIGLVPMGVPREWLLSKVSHTRFL